MSALNVIRQILLSLPLAVAWMLMLALVWLGWGTKAAEAFIVHWNAFVDEGPFGVGSE